MRRRRALRIVLVATGAILLATLLFVLFGAEPLARRVITSVLRSELDLEVTVGKLSGSLLFGVRAENVVVRDVRESALRSAKASVVEASYDLFTLLRGGSSWLHRVRVERPELSVDIDEPEPLAWRKITKGDGKGGRAPQIVAHGGRIEARSRGDDASLDFVEATIDPLEAGGLVVRFEAERADAEWLGRRFESHRLRGSLEVDRGVIRVPLVEDSTGPIARDAHVLTSEVGGSTRIEGRLLAASGWLDLGIDIGSSGVRVEADFADVDVESARRIADVSDPPISGSARGNVSLAIPKTGGRPRIAADVEIRRAGYAGRTIGKISISGRLADGLLVVERARLDAHQGWLAASGFVDASGLFACETSGFVEHTSSLVRESGLLDAIGIESVDVRGVLSAIVDGTVHEPHAVARLEQGTLEVEGVAADFEAIRIEGSMERLSGGISDLRLGGDRFFVEGDVELAFDRAWRCTATADVIDLALYSAALPRWLPPLEGALLLSGEAMGAGTALPTRARADVTVDDATIGPVRGVSASVTARLDGAQIDVDHVTATLARPPIALEASGRVTLFGAGDTRIDLAESDATVTFIDRSWTLTTPARATISKGVVAAGPIQLSGSGGDLRVEGRYGPGGSLSARATIQSLDVAPVLETVLGRSVSIGTIGGEAEIDGSLEAPRARVALASSISMSGTPVAPIVSVEAEYEAGVLRVDRLDAWLEAGEVTASGTVRGRISLDPPIVSFTELSPVDARARTSGLDLARVVDPRTGESLLRGMAGTIRADVRVSGTAGRPIFEGSATLEDGTIALGDNLPSIRDGTARVEATSTEITIVEATAKLGDAPVRLRGRVGSPVLHPRPLDVELDVTDFPIQSVREAASVEGLLSARATVRGTTASPLVEYEASATHLLHRGARADRVDVSGHAGNGLLVVERLVLTSSIGDLSGSGQVDFDLSLDPPRIGIPASGTIDGSVSTGRTDLAFLRDVVPALRTATGTAAAELRVTGPARHPRYVGSLVVREGTFRFEHTLPRIDHLGGRVFVDGERLVLDEVRGEMGGGPVSIDGQIEFEPVLRYDVTVHADRALVLDAKKIRARCNADLRLHSDGASGRLEGSVIVHRSLYSAHFTTGRESSGAVPILTLPLDVPEPLRDVVLDVRLSGADDIRVDNNVLRCGLEIDGKLGGTVSRPILDATVQVRDGRFAMPTADFVVENGMLTFYPRDPWRPYLDVLSRARIGGYEVTLAINGPADTPRLDLSSEPPLPYEDVVALVSTGYTREKLRQVGVGGAAAGQGLRYLTRQAKDGGSSPIGRTLGSIADRVSFQSESTTESTTARSSTPLQGIAEVKLTDTFFVQAQRDEFGHYNFDLVFRLRFR